MRVKQQALKFDFGSTNIEIKQQLKGTKIKLDKVPPVAQAKRRMPFALKKKVEKQIEHLEQRDIVEDITSEATPWLSQLVIVPKSNDDVRFCIDMRNADTAIERTHASNPTLDDLIFKLKGAKYFTKLDLNSAFHQLELHEDSRYITAFQTEDHIKRFKRLIFGLNSASEQLQHYLQIKLADIPGAINIAEGILIFVGILPNMMKFLNMFFKDCKQKD